MHDNHNHHHHHEHSTNDKEESLAMLTYMVEHNEHHTRELQELSQTLSGEAKLLIDKAVTEFENGTRLLADALNLLKSGE